MESHEGMSKFRATETIPPRLPPRLPPAVRPEADCIARVLATLDGQLDWARVIATATPWIEAVRAEPAPPWALEGLLHDYPLSSDAGRALMRLAEAMLRVPDRATAVALAADQLAHVPRPGLQADVTGRGGAAASWFAQITSRALAFGGDWLAGQGGPHTLLRDLGARGIVGVTARAVGLLGRQFVFANDIAAAVEVAARESGRNAGNGAARSTPAASGAGSGAVLLTHSFDMLGEGARTAADAARHRAEYRGAIEAVGRAAGSASASAAGPDQRDGISIKLSALHPRYEEAQRARVMAELVPEVIALATLAADHDISLTIDAEESERLELSLDVFEAALASLAATHPRWAGFGLAIQAYQTRALETVAHAIALARRHGMRLMLRLVKGAYWDAEIKRAQELGLAGYPVFTHKAHADASYLACARLLLAARPDVFPQFATHHAGTIAAVLALAGAGGGYEFQRLHGMGAAVFRQLALTGGAAAANATPATETARASAAPLAVRVYAPVGSQHELLPYLVRRLLENGANSSFVHQLADARVDVAHLLASPLRAQTRPGVPLPARMLGAREPAPGADLAERAEQAAWLAALDDIGAADARASAAASTARPVGADAPTPAAAFPAALAAQPDWDALGPAARAAILATAADALHARRHEFAAALVTEAHKTWPDAIGEVREAIDFLRYYADEAAATLADRALPGPTGERNTLRHAGRGAWVCISPWNFPLSIFTGQVAAALVAGNAVLAKPAEQTPAVALRMVALLHAAGVPRDVLIALPGDGAVGAALVADSRCAGVAFTGSTEVARAIARSLLDDPRRPIVPLVAETGGINAMIVDSTALPEQVVDAVVTSAFRSAGQRCSALRLLCVQDDIADALLAMLAGAMAELRLGDPADFATDIGPLIDADAGARVAAQTAALAARAKFIARTPLPGEMGGAGRMTPEPPDRSALPAGFAWCAPSAWQITAIGAASEEIFGPVLQVLRWKAGAGEAAVDGLVDQINALGYGLTLGVHTRIDARAARIARRARVGNVYVNRGMTGAVVGVQPFGGEGLSGTGPKAGGPGYLARFAVERVVTVNTTAAGGNVELLVSPAAGGCA